VLLTSYRVKMVGFTFWTALSTVEIVTVMRDYTYVKYHVLISHN